MLDLGGKAGRIVYRTKEGDWGKPNPLAVGENETRHGEFRVDQFEDFGANFVHRDIEDFADGVQLGQLVRGRGKQHFVQLLIGIFHRPFQLIEVNRFPGAKLESEFGRSWPMNGTGRLQTRLPGRIRTAAQLLKLGRRHFLKTAKRDVPKGSSQEVSKRTLQVGETEMETGLQCFFRNDSLAVENQ